MTKPTLADFQDDFVGALYGMPAQHPGVAALAAQPGFSIYRNTVIKGCIDALQANYPSVERLVGTEWFRSTAAVYVYRSPPTDTRLLHYGASFAAFLDTFEPARELPYLANVARLDRLWMEAHVAAEEPAADLASIAQHPPEAFGLLALRPRAGARWMWFADQPAYTIWRANREGVEVPADLAWHAEGALIVRNGGRVQWQCIDGASCAFLDACAAGHALERAATAAFAAQPDVDLMQLLHRLLSASALGAIAAPAQR
ncbi:MAG TPA: DNA-binding domain-containing protein [Paraburkholderia sp.]|jgi:hypothetical protein